jgi:transposase-like protein
MGKWKQVQEYANHIPSPLENYIRNKDKATHILLADALFTAVKGEDRAVMIAWDTGIGVVDYVIDATENKTAYSYLFQRLMDKAGYKPVCIVSDGHFSILPIIAERNLPHQRCTNHLLRELKRKLIRKGEAELVGRNKILYSRIKWVFHTKTIEDLPGRIRYFRTMAAPMFPEKTSVLRWFWRILPNAVLHLSYTEKVPPTTNRIENLNGQVKQRIKTMRGMKSEKSLNNLLKILFYFRKYK